MTTVGTNVQPFFCQCKPSQSTRLIPSYGSPDRILGTTRGEMHNRLGIDRGKGGYTSYSVDSDRYPLPAQSQQHNNEGGQEHKQSWTLLIAEIVDRADILQMMSSILH